MFLLLYYNNGKSVIFTWTTLVRRFVEDTRVAASLLIGVVGVNPTTGLVTRGFIDNIEAPWVLAT